MKTGRNYPCPCGSGKKYKKCCLLKNKQSSSTVFHFNEETDFPHIIPTAETLYDRIKDYDFQDLIVAELCQVVLGFFKKNI